MSLTAESGAVELMVYPEAHDDLPRHRPVMARQLLELLPLGPGDSLLDLTVGTGGHALALARRLGAGGLLVGIDADGQALRVAEERLSCSIPCPFRLFQCRFSEAAGAVREVATGGFTAVLADLGVGTHQLDDPGRGFSFDSESRLDMRYDTSGGRTAWDVVNCTPERELADIIYGLGEERLSRQIAAAICRRRLESPIETPRQLGDLIKRVAARRSGGRTWRIHPATRTAMAVRIFVNDELGELDRLLEILPSLLAPGGRAAVITYHSLEARRVKQAWRRQASEGILRLVTSRAVKPSPRQIGDNRRARSAQLRVAERP